MKPLKIRYARAVCFTIAYTLLVIGVFVGMYKLLGLEINKDAMILTVASSAILLHFVDKETQEHRKEEEE